MAVRRRAARTLVAAARVATLGACATENPVEGSRPVETGAGAFDLDEIEAGASVSLRVTVAEVLSPDSFVVPPEDTSAGPLLVLTVDHRAAPGDELQVAGIARVFSYEDLSGEYALAAQEAYADYDGKLVLVATLNDDDLPLDDK